MEVWEDVLKLHIPRILGYRCKAPKRSCNVPQQNMVLLVWSSVWSAGQRSASCLILHHVRSHGLARGSCRLGRGYACPSDSSTLLHFLPTATHTISCQGTEVGIGGRQAQTLSSKTKPSVWRKHQARYCLWHEANAALISWFLLMSGGLQDMMTGMSSSTIKDGNPQGLNLCHFATPINEAFEGYHPSYYSQHHWIHFKEPASLSQMS